MSGSSFEYLYNKRSEELLAERAMITAMADSMSELSHSSRAARDTEQVRSLLIQAIALLNQADAILDRGLADVWHDVEWYQSNDISRDSLSKAIVEYGLKR